MIITSKNYYKIFKNNFVQNGSRKNIHKMAAGFSLALTCINAVKEFNGINKTELPNFISQIESLSPVIDACEDGYKPILFSYIKAKCTDKASIALQNHDNISNWPTMKSVLVRTFAESETIIQLMDELKSLQLNGTIEGYYNKIKKIVHKINTTRILQNDNTYSVDEINRAALKTFKGHLPEPTKTLILARNPSDVDIAYSIVLEANHQKFTQNGASLANRNISYTQNNNHYRRYYPSNHNEPHNNNTHNHINNPHRSNSNPNNNNQRNYNYNSNLSSNSRRSLQNPNNKDLTFNNNNQNNRNFFPSNNYNRNNNYNNNNNRTFSQNTRRTFSNNNNYNNNNNISHSLNQVEPMEIGQQGTNFLAEASNSFHT